MARDWLAESGPPDAPQLPLNGSDGDRIRFRGGVGSIVGNYDRSLSNLDYEFEKHPSFYDYACGVMALNPTRGIVSFAFRPCHRAVTQMPSHRTDSTTRSTEHHRFDAAAFAAGGSACKPRIRYARAV
jgi:hypothetical protein